MNVAFGELVIASFCVANPLTGAAQESEGAISALLLVNGVLPIVENGGLISVSTTALSSPNVYASYYTFFTIPVESDPRVATGDVLEVLVQAKANGVWQSAIIWRGVIGETLDIFLRRWTQNKMIITVDGGGIETYTLRNDSDSTNYCHWTVSADGLTRSAIIFD